MRIGIHCSIRKSLLNAVKEAVRLKCQSMQIFTRSPRAWYFREISDDEIESFNKARLENNIFPLVTHIPYLPNLATSNNTLFEKSVDILSVDLRLSDRICADYLVVHVGSYSADSNLDFGIKRICDAIKAAYTRYQSRAVISLENVSGGGRRIGSSFEELESIIAKLKGICEIKICLDTAHLLAAGYDISNEKGVKETFGIFDKIIGLNNLSVIHLNDSCCPLGSRRDRHEHIGKGYVGARGFKALLNYPGLENTAVILETPKDSPLADRRNLELVRKLINR